MKLFLKILLSVVAFVSIVYLLRPLLQNEARTFANPRAFLVLGFLFGLPALFCAGSLLTVWIPARPEVARTMGLLLLLVIVPSMAVLVMSNLGMGLRWALTMAAFPGACLGLWWLHYWVAYVRDDPMRKRRKEQRRQLEEIERKRFHRHRRRRSGT